MSGSIRIERAPGPLRGRVVVPGSKSLSTRAIVLAALAPEPVLLRGVLAAEDTRNLARALGVMGGRVSRVLGDDWWVDGRELRVDRRSVRVDLGDGGAPTRFVMALAALREGSTGIDGSARMRERPIEEGVRLLRALGAVISHQGAPGRLPILVHGAMPGEPATLDIARTASSQFVSALMLIAPALPRGLRLRFVEMPTSASYLELTIDCMRRFGAAVHGAASAAGDETTVEPGMASPREFEIAPDASSAVAWVAAAAIVPGSRIELPGLRRDAQPDLDAIDALGAMGATLEWSTDGLVASHAPLRGGDFDASRWPDGALAVAAAAATARGATRLRSLGTLRVKESDRLAAMHEEYAKLGVATRIDGDDFVIEPAPFADAADTDRRATRACPTDAVIDPRRDHRIAMSLALVALRRGGVVVADRACVGKSYPAFWTHLASLTGERPVAV